MTFWSDLGRACSILRDGGVVGMPTETVYGLAACVNRPEAISALFRIKERPLFDPLIVHIAEVSDICKVAADFPQAASNLARQFWPGPLTIVLPKTPALNPAITAGLDTVAVRMPRHPLALRLIRRAGCPLAAPSANRFGRTSPTSAADVRKEFDDAVFVVDGGPCEVGLESTVVELRELNGKTEVDILRPGVITEEMISDVLGRTLVFRVQSAKSPGHLSKHYQPAIPLVVIEEKIFPPNAQTCCYIAEQLNLKACAYAELVLEDEAVLAARSLYRKLRDLATSGCDFIALRKDSRTNSGAWEAIWDRVGRAASLHL